MKTPRVDELIVKISCQTTGVSEDEALRQIQQIGVERKLELVEQILGHMDLYASDSKKPIRRKGLKRI